MKEENIIDLEKLRKQQAKISQAVEKFKKERAGLLPQFNLPGEEEPEEKEYPEELILAYELKEKIKEYTPGIREIKDNWLKEIEDEIKEGKTDQWSAWWALRGFSAIFNSPFWPELPKTEQNSLIKWVREIKDNWLKEIEADIEKGKTGQESVWWALRGFSALFNSPFWPELSKTKQNSLIKGVREIKDNWLKQIEAEIERGKTDQVSAWYALYGFSALLTFTSFYQKIGQKKMAQIEAEKAKKGLVKSIPPRPETRNF